MADANLQLSTLIQDSLNNNKNSNRIALAHIIGKLTHA